MKIWVTISDDEFAQLQEFSAERDISGEEIMQRAVALFLKSAEVRREISQVLNS